MPRRITLNDEETAELRRQEPHTAEDGGYQKLLVTLQDRQYPDTNELQLDDSDLEKISRYAYDHV